MFKFKSIYSESGSFTCNMATYIFANGCFKTEKKELAEFLRGNANFIEIKEKEEAEKKPEIDNKPEEEIKEECIPEEQENYGPEEILELEDLKAKAIAMGIKPHHKAGFKKIMELISNSKGK